MGIQIRPLTPKVTNVAALADYLAPTEDRNAPLVGATSESIGRYLSGAGDRVVAKASQVHGDAAIALGLAGQDVTLSRFADLLEGRHVGTGEQLTRSRAAPVYERDATGRVLKDENRQKIRALDEDGNPKSSTENQLLGIEIITEYPPAIRCLLVAAEAAGATQEVQRIKDRLAEVNGEFLSYVQHNVPLARRTIPAAMARATAGQAGAGDGGTVLTKPETKQQGSKTVYVPAELAIVAVPQWTARSNAETDQRPSGMPDPAPHNHNIIAPVAHLPGVEDDPTFGTQQGRFAKIDEYQLLKRAGELSAVHDAMAHKAVTDLGYETEMLTAFEQDPNGRQRWTVKGISREAEEFFSSNSRRLPTVVAEWEAKTGRTASPAMRTQLMRSTKGAKHKTQDTDPDWSHWVNDAAAAGVEVASQELVGKLMDPSHRHVERAPYEERVAELRRRLVGENGLHKDHATFNATEARASMARAAEGLDFSPDEFESVYLEALADDGMVIALNPLKADGSPQDYDKIIYSTPQMLASEHRVATAVRHKSKAAFPAVTHTTAAEVLGAHPHLDPEQRRAYAAITQGRGLVVLQGPAGTGKTSVVGPAIEALRKDKRIERVVVVSTAGRTAVETGRKLGADAMGSVDRIAGDVTVGRLKIDNRTLVVIDEAAMVDTARMKQISESLGAGRWVMTGDPHQMQPIGPGGWYQDVEAAHPTSIYRLSEVHRHVDLEDTRAYNALHEGRSSDFLDSMERRGRLHIDVTEQDSWDHIARNYAADLNAGHSAHEVRIIAAGGANRELDSWNRAVQKLRIDRGEISPEGFAMVATRTNRSWELHSGDAVMFLANHRGPDGTQIQNGVAGIARDVDPQTGKATLDLHDGRTVTVDLQRSAPVQPVVPAYAVHSAKFQGGQTKITHEVTPQPERLDAFATYVASTRAEIATHLYLNTETHGEQAKANVAEALQRRVFPRTAQSLDQRDLASPTPATPPVSAVATVTAANHAWAAETRRTQDARDQALAPHIQKAREGLRLSAIQPVVGPSVTRQVEASPAWKQLNAKLDQLETKGLDDRAMLVTAARQPGLSIAVDPAAELTKRLEGVKPVIKHAAIRPATFEPSVPHLVGPADRGPTRRRLDEDSAAQIADFAAGGRRGPALPPVPSLQDRSKTPPPPPPPGYQPKTPVEQRIARPTPPPPPPARQERHVQAPETHTERVARLLQDYRGVDQALERSQTRQQERVADHDVHSRPNTAPVPPPPPRREQPSHRDETHAETHAERVARLLHDYRDLDEALERSQTRQQEREASRNRDDGMSPGIGY